MPLPGALLPVPVPVPVLVLVLVLVLIRNCYVQATR